MFNFKRHRITTSLIADMKLTKILEKFLSASMNKKQIKIGECL